MTTPLSFHSPAPFPPLSFLLSPQSYNVDITLIVIKHYFTENCQPPTIMQVTNRTWTESGVHYAVQSINLTATDVGITYMAFALDLPPGASILNLSGFSPLPAPLSGMSQECS
jgi:hypothetical protein